MPLEEIASIVSPAIFNAISSNQKRQRGKGDIAAAKRAEKQSRKEAMDEAKRARIAAILGTNLPQANIPAPKAFAQPKSFSESTFGGLSKVGSQFAPQIADAFGNTETSDILSAIQRQNNIRNKLKNPSKVMAQANEIGLG